MAISTKAGITNMAKSFTVKRNEKVGRYIVASKNLEAGEVVLSEIPFVVGPKSSSPPLCLGCYSVVDCLVSCTVCHWPVCNEQCQEKPEHREAECTVFSAANVRYRPESEEEAAYGSPQYECITPLRMLLNKEHDPVRWEAEISTMESHTEVRKDHPDWAIEHINIVEFLRRKCKLANRFGEEIIHWVIGVLEVNAFEVRTVNGNFVRGLYPQIAMMSHSCVANTTHSIYANDSYRIYVRTTVDVPEGNELHVSYTSSIQPTLFRRENLKLSKYFDCDCKRCEDPTELGTHLSSLKCTKCGNGVITSSNPLDQKSVWNCSHCEFSIRPDTLRKIFKMFEREIEQVETVENLDDKIMEVEKLLSKYKSVLNPCNVYIISLKYTLAQLYGRAPGFKFEDLPNILLERKIELCQQILKIADVIKPGLNRFRGTLLYELHVALLIFDRNRYKYGEFDKEELKKKMEQVSKILEEAVSILSLEDPTSPEGKTGQTGKASLENLKLSIDQL